MPLSALYQQLRQAPDDDVDTIAANLGRQYGWSPEAQEMHRRRMFDIRGTTMLTILDEASAVPGRRTPERLDKYRDGLDHRVAVALSYREHVKDQ